MRAKVLFELLMGASCVRTGMGRLGSGAGGVCGSSR